MLVTGGAGYIGSHAALRLLRDSYRVTIVVIQITFKHFNNYLMKFEDINKLLISQQDNLSRGNLGAVKTLQRLFPQTGRLQFIYADLGDPVAVSLYNLFDVC